MGNSAMDIAVDASYHATTTYLSARRGVHILPKYMFGKPVDTIGGSERIPMPVRAAMFRRLLKLHVGEALFDGVVGADVIVTFGGVVSRV